jgi:hypothetical protein
MATEPGEPEMLEGKLVDEGLRVLGDFADLTIPYTLGHSAAVAELAAAAGEQAGSTRKSASPCAERAASIT